MGELEGTIPVTDDRTVARWRDISAQELTEDEFKRFFNLIPEMACIATHDARLLKINPAWQRILGYSEQELLATTFLDFIHPDDRDRTVQAIQDELAAGEDTRSFANRYRCKGGGYKWLEWTSSPAANKSLLFATARDITERHLAEDALRESRNFAVNILDSLGEHIAVLDETGVITAVNRAWSRFAAENGNPELGGSAVVGVNYFAVCSLPPRDPDNASAAAARAGIQSVLSGAMDSFTLEYPCHSPDEKRWFEMRVRRLQNAPTRVVVAHENITARIHYDEALHLRDAALEATDTAILTANRHGLIIWANKALSVLTGYPNDEVLGRTPGMLSKSGKHDAAFYQDLWGTILAGKVWRGELINRRKNGSLYHEQQTITPVRDGRGEISQFIAIKQDISDRKQLEAALRDSEERYRMIFEMSTDAILVINPDDASTSAANPAACRMFGYSEAEICRLGRAGLMDETDPDWPDLLAERNEQGHARGEVRFVRRNGDIFPAETSFIVFPDSKGRQRGIVNIRDISDRIHAEKALRESEMRWQFAVESHGDAMWDWDADKDVLFLTSAARELFNLPDTGSARPIADLLYQVDSADRALVKAQIDDILLGRTTEWRGESRFSTHEQEPRWVATRGRVMTRGADGRPSRIVSISSDITRKRAMQSETRRQSALVAQQARLVLLGELASALAHEINQPLTAIMGFSAACARKLAGQPEVLELIQAIESQALRGGEIAWRMRGFARRQSQGRTALSVHEVVAGVVKWIRVDSVFSDAVIDISGIDSSLPLVNANRVELEQVLVNLVRNGIEASLPNIRERPITIATCPGARSGEIEITVTDSGRGLPATPNFEVFKPFTSTKEQGLGLGLTICYSIIEGHGGHLWATPNPAGGTIFHFTLPVAPLADELSHHPMTEHFGGGQ